MIYNWIVEIALEIFNCFYEIINNAYKSTVVTITGSVAGYTPQMLSQAIGSQVTSTEKYIQYAIWTVTLVVGVFAIINAIQKQTDRYRRNKYQKIRPDEKDMEEMD